MSAHDTVSSEAVASTISCEIEWPTDPASYHFSVQIGKGAFATVWKAETRLRRPNQYTSADPTASVSVLAPTTTPSHESSSSPVTSTPIIEVAVKVLNLESSDTNLDEIRQEVHAMRLSLHPNLLNMYAAFLADTNLWLVTPLMRKGSSVYCITAARKILQQSSSQYYVSRTKAMPMDAALNGVSPHPHPQHDFQSSTPPPLPMQEHILYILRETILGLQYLHDNHQIHRDMKGGNILLDSDGSVKIGDFGVSSFVSIHNRTASTFVGTPCWMAPEVMEQVSGYDSSADIWSLGITALELARGYAPYARFPPMKVLILTIQEPPPSLETYKLFRQSAHHCDDDDDDDDDDGHYQDHHVDHNNPKNDNLMIQEQQEEFSHAFTSFVDVCLQKNPLRRPSCAELLQKYLVMDETTRQERKMSLVEQVCDIVPNVGSSSSSSVSSSTSTSLHIRQPRRPTSSSSSAQLIDSATMPDQGTADPISSSLMMSEKDRPPGTTWIFADSSTASDEAVSPGHHDHDGGDDHYDLAGDNGSSAWTSRCIQSCPTSETIYEDDVLSVLDEFGRQTGGENYYGRQSQSQQDNNGLQILETDHNPLSAVATTTLPITTDNTVENDSTAASIQLDNNAETRHATDHENQMIDEANSGDEDLSAFMDEFERANTAGEDFRRVNE